MAVHRFIVFIMLAASIAFAQDKAPQIHFQETSLQFQNAVPDSLIKAVFHFSNNGQDTLRILALRPG